jgi:site-specific DNA recombinase
MSTYGYARLSKDDVNSLSIGDQAAKINAFAVGNEREPIVEVITDNGESGAKSNRPGFVRLQSLIRSKECSAVIVYKLDRLTRKTRDLIDFIDLCEKYDVAFLCVHDKIDTSTASGRMFVKMLGVINEFEREQIIERTTAALKARRESGKMYGMVPFGFRRAGQHYVEDEREQSILAVVRRMRDAGESYEAIAAALNVDKLTNRAGSAWTRQSVRKLCGSIKFKEAS